MNQMKAIVKRSSHPSDFGLTEVPIPKINDNELLVRVQAIGVGIHDSYFLPKTMHDPYPIGIEAAGIIQEIGRNILGYQVGDRIAFVSAMQIKGGTWAEFAVVSDDSLILPIPQKMSFVEAAAIPVAGNTALKAFHSLQLKPNDSLFIAGASGAIGTFAIQLATKRGFIVAGSASKRNHEYMLALGAQKVVDYNDPDWPEQIKRWMPGGVDAAMAIQPGTGRTSVDVLKDGGKIVAVSGDQFMPHKPVDIRPIAYHLDVRAELMQLMDQIVSNEIKLFIEHTYPFEKGLEALQKTTTRRARGKLVISMP